MPVPASLLPTTRSTVRYASTNREIQDDTPSSDNSRARTLLRGPAASSAAGRGRCGIPTVEQAQCAFDLSTLLRPASQATSAVSGGLSRPTSQVIPYHESFRFFVSAARAPSVEGNDATGAFSPEREFYELARELSFPKKAQSLRQPFDRTSRDRSKAQPHPKRHTLGVYLAVTLRLSPGELMDGRSRPPKAAGDSGSSLVFFFRYGGTNHTPAGR